MFSSKTTFSYKLQLIKPYIQCVQPGKAQHRVAMLHRIGRGLEYVVRKLSSELQNFRSARARRLICNNVVCMYQKQHFVLTRLILHAVNFKITMNP